MDKFLLAPTLIRLLREHRFFAPLFSWILRIQAALAAIGGILISIELWKQSSGASTGSIFGLLILQVCLLVALYFVCHLSWIRAMDLKAMDESKGDALSVIRLLIKLGGELYAGALAPLTLGGTLLLWISGGESGYTLRALFAGFLPLTTGDAFQAGLAFLATGLGMAACGLLSAYALSKLIGLLVSIEQNTRRA